MSSKNHKYIFVVGGVMSGVGKGIATASMGTILQSKGFKVNLVKVDPYLNVDAGTMNPTEHGEVFVLDSGLETDQDMGNYERFLNRDLSHEAYMTSGMVYKAVIDRERALSYKGKCVEAIPHVTDEITRRIKRSAEVSGSDITIVEIGGTIGDYQNMLFIEAARILKLKHAHDVIFILVSFLPVPHNIGEMKTRPTQHAVRQLNSYGVQPDILIARGSMPLDERRKEKIAIACNIPAENIISAPDIESVYDVPLNFEKDMLGYTILKSLHMRQKSSKNGISEWKAFAKKVHGVKEEITIGVVGKYFNTGDFVLKDAYLSVLEAIKYSAYKLGYKPIIQTINAGDFEGDKPDFKVLDNVDAILVPGGFGQTGIEGKINVIKYAREKKIPYFGLCYGMQLLVIEYARNVAKLEGANTAEIDPESKHLVVDIMLDQKAKLKEGNMGGSMRLGAYPAALKKNTIARTAYGEDSISERHRHRYEVNNAYIPQLEKAGLIFSGTSPDGNLMEIAELPKSQHPFFLGTQFHPELKARPLNPHPLFTEFLKAAIARKK